MKDKLLEVPKGMKRRFSQDDNVILHDHTDNYCNCTICLTVLMETMKLFVECV